MADVKQDCELTGLAAELWFASRLYPTRLPDLFKQVQADMKLKRYSKPIKN